MIVYMAHPVRPTEGETVEGNLMLAERWLRWCHARFPAWTTTAPWLDECRLYGDADEHRAESMARMMRVLERLDAVVLVGQRISPGMRAEARHAFARGLAVYDLTYLGQRDPASVTEYDLVAFPVGGFTGQWPEGLTP